MPNLNGIDAAENYQEVPALGRQSISLLNYDSPEVARAHGGKSAPRGYIAKVHIPTDLVPAIESGCRLPAR